MSRPFLKMNGLGNDFVVVEARALPFEPTADQVRNIARREGGIGCDQLISISPGQADIPLVRFWNADGEEVGACGNGACAALVAAARRGLTDRKATLELDGGDLVIDWRASDDHVIMTGPVAIEFEGQLP